MQIRSKHEVPVKATFCTDTVQYVHLVASCQASGVKCEEEAGSICLGIL